MTTQSSVFGGGGSQLAPDLTFPSDKQAGDSVYKTSAVTDYSTGGLVEAFSLTGPGVLQGIKLSGLTAESITVKLTIDSVVIWNDTYTCGTTETLMGRLFDTGSIHPESYTFNTSAVLALTTSDSAIVVNYFARPTL